jgi:hypothetical protein
MKSSEKIKTSLQDCLRRIGQLAAIWGDKPISITGRGASTFDRWVIDSQANRAPVPNDWDFVYLVAIDHPGIMPRY